MNTLSGNDLNNTVTIEGEVTAPDSETLVRAELLNLAGDMLAVGDISDTGGGKFRLKLDIRRELLSGSTQIRFLTTTPTGGVLEYFVESQLQLDDFPPVELKCPAYSAPKKWEHTSNPFARRLYEPPQYLLLPQIGGNSSIEWGNRFVLKLRLEDPTHQSVYGGLIRFALGESWVKDNTKCQEKSIYRKTILEGKPEQYTTTREVQSAFWRIWSDVLSANANYLTRDRRRDTAALIDRLLNGICPAVFQTVAGSSDLVVKFEWPDPPQDKKYWTPSVEARFATDTKAITLKQIAYRWPSEQWTPVYPTDQSDDCDANSWGYAKRLLRICLLLSGEIDCHVARGHLLAEQYLLALKQAEKATGTENPLSDLLLPHIEAVADINNYGNPTIFAETTILCRASGLGYKEYNQRLARQLGMLDWKYWEPRLPVCEGHRYARLAVVYWEVVRQHVDAVFTIALIDQLKAFRPNIKAFSDRLQDLCQPVPDDFDAFADSLRPGDRSEFTRKPQKSKSVSEINVSNDDDMVRDLKQICRYIIFHATFYHGWINDQQIVDGGDVFAASFGLRDRKPMQREQGYETWNEGASPLPEDASFQLFLADSLSMTKFGYVIDNEIKDDMIGKLATLLNDAKGIFQIADPSFDIKTIRSCINI